MTIIEVIFIFYMVFVVIGTVACVIAINKAFSDKDRK